MFLEELKSINIMNTGLSKKKSKGRPEDECLKGGKIEDTRKERSLLGNICEAISVHLPHEQRDKKS